IQFTLEVPIPM
ncbi:hypothetical protein VN97_g6896, partial [Penicillium thymicola]